MWQYAVMVEGGYALVSAETRYQFVYKFFVNWGTAGPPEVQV